MRKLSNLARDWIVGLAWGLVGLGLLVVIVLMLARPAHAQVVPGELTFNLSQTTQADGKVIPSLTWGTKPSASRCVSSGGWTGSRSVNRSTPLVLPAVAPPVDFTMTCYWDDIDQRLTWIPPTQNADGSPLTNLAGFRIYYGNSGPGNLTQTIQIADPGAKSRLISPLSAGVWHFAMTAYNTPGQESARSGTVSSTQDAADVVKTVTASAQVPNSPTGLVLTDN